jgi:TIR domain
MQPKVFISHSTKDKAIAAAICHQLESAGIKCWIAPRDIEPGSSWTEAIMRGIETCRALVLIFSANANDSEHVRREVAKAFSLKLAVIPFRTEEVLPNRSLGYFLETVQWLDAVSPPLQKHLDILAERVKQLPADEPASVPDATVITPERKVQPKQSAISRRALWTGGVLLAGAAIVLATVVWLFAIRNQSGRQTSVSSVLPAIPGKSIAVLPFESLSDDKKDTYFADGVQDEILNNLAAIAELKVVSRTSVMQYRDDKSPRPPLLV